MADERKQDLGSPDEEALEQHVRQMLDVTVPDEPETEAASTAGQSSPASAPEVKGKSGQKSPIAISVTSSDDDAPTDAKESPDNTDLVAAIEETNKQLAAQQTPSAPLVTPTKPGKKLTITHFDDEPEKSEDVHVTAEEPQLPAPASASVEQSNPVAPSAETPDIADSPLEKEIESAETERAVTDIIATESDKLLAIDDQLVAPQAPVKPKRKRRGLFSLLRRSSAARWTLALLMLLGLGGLAAFPTTRYAILNAAGVRSSASLTVVDQTTRQPLKNVTVTINDRTVQTNQEGVAQLDQLKLGPTEVKVERRAFTEQRRPITIGWGSNPLGEFNLEPKGSQYTLTIADVISGAPIANAEATVDDLSTQADDKGVIKLTLDGRDVEKVSVTITAEGYRNAQLDLTLANKQNIDIKLTPSQQVVFISKRSGTYDVYKIDVDGKNESLLLTGTGNERNDIVLTQHPSDNIAMLVSERTGSRSTTGDILRELTFINVKDGATKQVAQSSQLRVVDWIGSRLVYVQLNDDAKPDDPQRYKLMSYDYRSGDNRQLAATNYFNDVLSADGKVYYAPSSAYQEGVNIGVFAVFADGSGKEPLLDKEVWNMHRTAHNQITLAVQQEWYSYTLGDKTPKRLDGQPSLNASRAYSDSPDGKYSIWVDDRDGKGTLVLYDIAARSEKVIHAQNGVRLPIRWVHNNIIVFRVVTDQETADYAVSIQGGPPVKISNVTNSLGVDRWTL